MTTYRYNKIWLEYETEYNKFHGKILVDRKIIKDSSYFFYLDLFQDQNNEYCIGSNINMSLYPLKINGVDDGIFQVKHIKRFFKSLKKVILDWVEKYNLSRKQTIYFHQDPKTTIKYNYSLLDSLKKEELDSLKIKINRIERSRSWIDIKKINRSFDQLKKHFRQSYRNIINRNDFKSTIYNSKNTNTIINDKIKSFKNKHLDLAGKETKSDQCWNYLGQLIKEDQAFLVELDNNYVYFLYDNDHEYVYYGINASSKRDYITHKLISDSVKYLLNKENNVKYIDLGRFYWNQPGYNKEFIFDFEKEDPVKQYEMGFFKMGFSNYITSDYYYQITFDLS